MRGGGEKGKGRGARKGSHIDVAADLWLVMAGLVPRLSGWSFGRRWRRELPPPLWGRAGEGGRANLTEYGSWRRFGQVSATPLPNPPPQGGREFQHSTRRSYPCPLRCQSSQSSANSGLSELRGFPQLDSRGTSPAMTDVGQDENCWSAPQALAAKLASSPPALYKRPLRAQSDTPGGRARST
jgi:hypothetical protein